MQGSFSLPVGAFGIDGGFRVIGLSRYSVRIVRAIFVGDARCSMEKLLHCQNLPSPSSDLELSQPTPKPRAPQEKMDWDWDVLSNHFHSRLIILGDSTLAVNWINSNWFLNKFIFQNATRSVWAIGQELFFRGARPPVDHQPYQLHLY